MALTKTDIVKRLWKKNDFSKAQSAELVETMIKFIKDTLESGEDVLISGFGKFCVKSKKERRGRNPSTGDALMIDPRKIVTFKVSGKLRERVNTGG